MGDDVRFVLVEPGSGGNVGAAARALANLGFDRLSLVRPRCDPRGREARTLAVDAVELLDGAEIHEDLDSALEGARSVVGTSARTGRQRRPHWRLDAFSDEIGRLTGLGGLAILFGREDRGLTDAELDRCTHLVQFAAAERYPSFNLSQAVLLVAYTLRIARIDAPEPALEPPATHAAREAMYRHLERALLAIGFLQAENRGAMMRKLRRLLGRAWATADEVQVLRGIARQTLWAAERAGLELPRRDPR